MFGVPPDVSKFRPIGYPTLIWLDKSERAPKHPNQPKAVVGTVIGYSEEVKNAYIVLVKNKLYTRRDVIVNENYSKLRDTGRSEEEIQKRMMEIIFPSEKDEEDSEEEHAEEIIPQNLSSNSTTPTIQPTIAPKKKKNGDRRSVDDSDVLPNNQQNHSVVDSIIIRESEKPSTSIPFTNTMNHPSVSVDDNLVPALHRRSARNKSVPDRLTYNVDSNKKKAETAKLPIIKFKSGDVLPPTPNNLNEALEDANAYKAYWLEATCNEMQVMTDRNVFEYVDEQEYSSKHNGKKPLAFKSKLAFRVSTIPHKYFSVSGLELLIEILKFKARLVACGYAQLFGVHYDKSNFPTACFRSILTLLHIAVIYGWERAHLDVGNAYLEADIDKEIYMYLPMDWTRGRKILVKLNKNLYGLKQAGLLWYLLMKRVLIELNYFPSIWDPCVFVKRDENSHVTAIIGVHVDDEAIISNSKEEMRLFKQKLSEKFRKISDLSALTEFLGIKITTNEKCTCFHLSQEDLIDKYIRELAIGLGEFKTSLPGPSNVNFEDTPPNKKNEPIWSEIGTISHFALHTRPDLACVCALLGKFQRYPHEEHLKVLKQANNYIQNTKDFKLKLGGEDKEIKLFFYCDSSFKRGGDGKSRYGISAFLGKTSGSVYWKSQQSKVVSTSSTESEIYALVEAIKDAMWFRGLLQDLGFEQRAPTVIYQDNNPVLQIAELQTTPSRTRHIMNKINFVKQEIELGTVSLVLIPDEIMVADALTKLVPKKKHEFCTNILLNGHDNNVPTGNKIVKKK
jgi:hypothetical protein